MTVVSPKSGEAKIVTALDLGSVFQQVPEEARQREDKNCLRADPVLVEKKVFWYVQCESHVPTHNGSATHGKLLKPNNVLR